MSCCRDINLTIDQGCPPPIFDNTQALTVASPIATHRPGCFVNRYPIHLEKGQFYSIRILGTNFNPPAQSIQSPACDQCDTYLYLLDNTNAIVVENDDQAMGLNSQLAILIETTGDYFIEATTFSPGDTGTIRTTVFTCLDANFAGNSAVAGTGTSFHMVAPQSVTPLTWSVASGTLPSGLSLVADNDYPVTGIRFFGRTEAWGRYFLQLKVTDANGMSRTATVQLKVIAFTIFHIFPTFILSPPIGSPFTFVINPVGGNPPYTFSHYLGTPPGGLTFNSSTGSWSGTADGTNLPTSDNVYIIDADGDYSGVGIEWLTCTGQSPISALIWAESKIIPNPGAGDSITGSAAGGDGSYVLQNFYAGGACVDNPTRLVLTAQLCNPTPNTDYQVTFQARAFGSMGNSGACPANGSVALFVNGFGIPSQAQLSGTGGQLYDFSTEVLTATIPSGGVLNISVDAQVVYSDMNLSFTFRPLTHP